ncbi:MAG TPA: toll/interleukin-1 receptor domain-containing protein [Pyrinomonadaceae bacterium]|nr:toll/interleukin-1 receptor domain-containing protein [Pyrinomonadaceae bacterium]
MALSTRPFLVIYVAWHPDFADGEAIAKSLYDHYRRDLYENVAGGAGLSVIYRSTLKPGSSTPIDIDFNDAETSAIVLLLDRHWVTDPAWITWAHDLTKRADAAGLAVRVFPVAIDEQAIQLGVAEQAVRWDKWASVALDERERRLIGSLTYQFCRMLRHYLAQLKHPTKDEEALLQYLTKVAVFLSHSKHDSDGERIANLVRDNLYGGEGDNLASFFDVHDIPAGLRFNKVILQKVKVSAVVAIHTDSYSSREWCRREIIEAKRWSVPLVVANCVSDIDERSFPYMGNVPLVRMDPNAADRIEYVVRRLLDEILKDFLWRCRIELVAGKAGSDVTFLPRPPELISLAALKSLTSATLVYPDPPIGAEEQRLFEVIAPAVRLRSMTEWLAETTI